MRFTLLFVLANDKRVAVPIAGPGGKIAVYELGKPGRLPDGVIPSLVNGSNIMDFQWDPFDATKLAVACDDGIVKIWQVPEEGKLSLFCFKMKTILIDFVIIPLLRSNRAHQRAIS